MEKVIIRTQLAQGISSKMIRMSDEAICSLEELCARNGKDIVLKDVFAENSLSYKQLYEQYQEYLENDKNKEFETMYLLGSGFGVVISEHIYLCHVNESVFNQQESVFPWRYVESKKYVGDSWWYEDHEIINDMQKLSLLKFLEKYKGY